MSSTVLVTAATGKTGRHLVTDLVDRGVDVRAGSRTPGQPGGHVTPVRFDLSDPTSFDDALEGVDAVYLVGVADVGDAAPLADAFLDRAEAASVRRVVQLSAMGADQAPEFGIGRIERMLDERELDATIVAPNWFNQNFDQSFFLPMIRNGAIRVPAGNGAVSFVDTRDIAAVAAVALTEDGHVGQRYVVTGPEALTFTDVAATVSDAADRDVEYVDIASDEMLNTLHDAGFEQQYAGMMLGLFDGMKAGYAAPVTDTVATVTGRAAIAFGDYAKQHADAWRA